MKSDGAVTERKVRNVTLWGLLLNLLLTGVKFAIGVMFGSQACTADAVHSLSDSVTDIAVIIGVHFWSEPADKGHPHGHQRIEALVTLFIGAALVLVACTLAFKALQSVGRDGSHVLPEWPVFFAALISIAVKEFQYRWTAAAGALHHSQAMIANAWHHRSDALSSIPVAAAVILGKIWPSLTHVDACAALLVSVMLLRVAWNIACPALRELADEGADGAFVGRISVLASSVPGVREVHSIRTRRVGDGFSIDLHVLVAPDMTVEDGHRICDEVCGMIQRKEPRVVDVLTHLEPLFLKSVEEQIREIAMGVDGVRDVHRVRVRRILSGYDADLHVLVAPDMSVRSGHEICNAVQKRLSDSGICVVEALIHLEPYEDKKENVNV